MNEGEYAKMYELEDHYWWFVGRRRLALDMLRAAILPDERAPRVLDLGCGTGVVLRELSEWAWPLGVDLSATALGFCRRRGVGRIVRGDGARLPIASSRFDAVLGLDIFEHIEDDRAAFAEAFRVLRPGGALVLSVPAFASLWGPHDVALMHHRRYRKSQVARLLSDAGFVVERLSYSVFFLFPAVVGWRLIEKRRPGPAKASLVPVAPWLNRGLIGLQTVEAALVARADLPWGSSVVAVGRKPGPERVLLPASERARRLAPASIKPS